ncbi:orotate phosphoribosyltransferase [Calycina marina]|uniref:Orotate phosphoribosyltransferase n=1 Tax=Calycina marina TaxID=1763456 RepID=A0A9P7ZCG8_9HELO|nr:orotate phosphoribosyltransferase [Calycina marina]
MAMIETKASPIASYKTAFLESCLEAKVLSFGTFKLKSSRISPYFFNAGNFHRGDVLFSVATAYAQTIINFLASNPSIAEPDVIFGPAYKGIPLACTVLLELYRLDPETWQGVSYSFNRKEIKDHGEGGNIVGAGLKGKNVLVIDDVITAGTAMKETIELVNKEGGKISGFVVALDRMEKMPGPNERETGVDDKQPRMSAMGQLKQEFGVETISIVTLDDLIALLKSNSDMGDLSRLEEYRQKYLASD